MDMSDLLRVVVIIASQDVACILKRGSLVKCNSHNLSFQILLLTFKMLYFKRIQSGLCQTTNYCLNMCHTLFKFLFFIWTSEWQKVYSSSEIVAKLKHIPESVCWTDLMWHWQLYWLQSWVLLFFPSHTTASCPFWVPVWFCTMLTCPDFALQGLAKTNNEGLWNTKTIK